MIDGLFRSQQIRLCFVEAMFIVHGCVRRSNVTETFDVATACACRTLSTYAEMNNGVTYSHNHHSWLTRGFYKPSGLLTVPPEDYLRAISLIFEAPDFSRPGSVRVFASGEVQ